jgi:hypothetical protein
MIHCILVCVSHSSYTYSEPCITATKYEVSDKDLAPYIEHQFPESSDTHSPKPLSSRSRSPSLESLPDPVVLSASKGKARCTCPLHAMIRCLIRQLARRRAVAPAAVIDLSQEDEDWYEDLDGDRSWLLHGGASPLRVDNERDEQTSKPRPSSPVYLDGVSIPNVWGTK